MQSISLSTKFIALFFLLGFSAFFSISETAMMACNRYRLRFLAQKGHSGAKKALTLLDRTDKMLGVVLLGNNLVNAAAATLAGLIALELAGDSEWALGIATLSITFAILVFSEITPKIIGAHHADKLAVWLAYILLPLLRLFYPVIWFVNLFASGLLHLLRLHPKESISQNLSPEELRSMVLESLHVMPKAHRDILNALFDLNHLTVEDIMTPRGAVEILDIDCTTEDIRRQITTAHHGRIPVCRGSLDQLLGMLSMRRLLGEMGSESFSVTMVETSLQPAYYIPKGTPILTQLSFFQENRQRIGFVIDEYGDIQGLLTAEDIIEELVGDFTTSLSGMGSTLLWSPTGDIVVEGSRTLRELNRKLGLHFPIDGAKTLNGLITDILEEIPDGDLSLKINGITVEILQSEDRSVVTARLYRPEKNG